MTSLEKWAVFFQYASMPTKRETINKVIESKEVLQMASDLLMSISQDEKERAVFRSRRMYETDLQSNIATAEDRGRAEGRAEGELRGITLVARNMKLKKIPIADIALLTGLNVTEIEKI
jgi:predicted transposase/invertase (TIGR01784 family)